MLSVLWDIFIGWFCKHVWCIEKQKTNEFKSCAKTEYHLRCIKCGNMKKKVL